MSQLGGKPLVAIIDSKELRRASITSLLDPWAKAEDLRLASLSPVQACETLHSETDLRMLIFCVGGNSIAEREHLQQLNVLRALAPNVPLVVISDREDIRDIAAAFDAKAQGFINSGISFALAYQALSFVMNGGSYFPPSAIHQLKTGPKPIDMPSSGPPANSDSENKHNGHGENPEGWAPSRDHLDCQSATLTTRQREVLEHLRLGESNKIIGRQLGMTEGTVKVHIRQMMRKCHASNRTQLAMGGSRTAEDCSIVDSQLPVTEAASRNTVVSFKAISSANPEQSMRLVSVGSRRPG